MAQSSHATFIGIKVGKINPILYIYQEFKSQEESWLRL